MPGMTSRGLYRAIDRIHGDSSRIPALLDVWARDNDDLLKQIAALGHSDAADSRISDDLSFELYALSRISDVLLRGYQPAQLDGSTASPSSLIREHHLQFARLIGAQTFREATFHPWFHEITGVHPASLASQEIAVESNTWPGLVIGSMLFAREGVGVVAGSDHLQAQVAATSTLYWAYSRLSRPTVDLASGWGSNSQWRTRFRRDYISDLQYTYNVDHQAELTTAARGRDPRLSGEEALDLLRYRHSITTDLGGDQPIWALSHSESRI